MIHILLLLLKIVGIILISILALILLLAVCILFVPIRYNGYFEKYDKTNGYIKIHYLLHAITIFVKYDAGEIESYVKILGFRLKRRQKKHSVKASKNPEVNNTSVKSEIQDKKIQTADIKENHHLQDSKNDKQDKKAGKRHIPNPFRMIKNLINKIKKIKEKRKKIIEFLKNENTKLAFKSLKKELIFLLKKLLPRRLKVDVRFGFDDPADTGYVLGVINIFYKVRSKMNIYPDFNNKVFEGNVKGSGHIRLIYPLVSFVKLWKNLNVKNTLERVKQI